MIIQSGFKLMRLKSHTLLNNFNYDKTIKILRELGHGIFS